MKKFLLLALMIAAPATARADLVYKCSSEKFSDQLSANLRFDDRGRGGRIEVDYWAGYPPVGLVYADLRSPGTLENGQKLFPSELDSHSKTRAEITVPGDFLKTDDFLASIALIDAKGTKTYTFRCERF